MDKKVFNYIIYSWYKQFFNKHYLYYVLKYTIYFVLTL